jgi:predicted subunit of tRNA(5-methylaminomethyl-2-thiouridylate) methyltransferase
MWSGNKVTGLMTNLTNRLQVNMQLILINFSVIQQFLARG